MRRMWWFLAGGALAGLASWYALQRLRVRPAQCEDEPESDTARIRRQYNAMASSYDRTMPIFERVFLDGDREWAASQAHGDVLEIAIGTGRNLPYYGEDVCVSGLDLSPEMLAIARERAARLALSARLDVGDAQVLGYPDDSFDAVVCTFALCSIPDPERALEEVRRVLRPGGRFIAVEHVRSPVTPVQLVQRALNPLTVRFGGDHLLRDPLDDLRPLGFEIEQLERSKLSIIERVVAGKPAVAGE